MKQTYTWQQKINQLLAILVPILITQVSLCGMNFFDTTMSGQAGRFDLAGVAIGNNIWMPVFTGVNGILIAITPIIAQNYGAGRRDKIGSTVIQGVYLASMLAIFVILSGAVLITPLFNLMQLEPGVQDIAYRFLGALAIGIVPFFISTILRNFVEALGYTYVTMLIMLSALPVNIALNYVLIFGKFGFPELGGVGAGYATAITYWCIAVINIVIICIRAPFKGYGVFSNFPSVSLRAWKEQLRIGVPIGFSIFCETSIFGAVALLMAKFGTVTIAAHQAAINFASLLYMLPLSIGMALTIVIGFEVGAQRFDDARRYSYLGIVLALCIALFSAIGLFSLNEQVAGLYTADYDVLQMTKQFLWYAIFFQLADALGAPIQGALRGYKDVKITFIMAIVSYWIIGLPAGVLLVNNTSLGAFGYWIGLIVGLIIGAGALLARLIKLQRMKSKLEHL